MQHSGDGGKHLGTDLAEWQPMMLRQQTGVRFYYIDGVGKLFRPSKVSSKAFKKALQRGIIECRKHYPDTKPRVRMFKTYDGAASIVMWV